MAREEYDEEVKVYYRDRTFTGNKGRGSALEKANNGFRHARYVLHNLPVEGRWRRLEIKSCGCNARKRDGRIAQEISRMRHH